MASRRQKKEAGSLRTPQPKKLGLSVPPLLRLPHEQLIRAQQSSEERSVPQRSSEGASPPDTRVKAIEISQADSASLADLDPPKNASLAKTSTLAMQIARLANPASLANSAGLPLERDSVSLMDSLPEIGGFTKLHHQIVDHLYSQLSAKEQIVHLQLYRLAWGSGRPNCFISLPKLARRSNLSQRSTADATTLLENKGLIRKGAVTTGKGKQQGIEYWVTPAPALAKSASLATSASHAPIARHAESDRHIEYKEELQEHTHKEASVGVLSRFSLEECRRYAQHLQRTGQGITNPGGYATIIHRTGEVDVLIEQFLAPQPSQPDFKNCPDCKGQGFKRVNRDGREGVIKCAHGRLEVKSPGDDQKSLG